MKISIAFIFILCITSVTNLFGQAIHFDSAVLQVLYRYKYGEFNYQGNYCFKAFDNQNGECFSIQHLENDESGIHIYYFFQNSEPAFTIENNKISEFITYSIDSTFALVNQIISKTGSDLERLRPEKNRCHLVLDCDFEKYEKIYSYEGRYDRGIARQGNEMIVKDLVKFWENSINEIQYDSMDRVLMEKLTLLNSPQAPIEKYIHTYESEKGNKKEVVLEYSDLSLVGKTINVYDAYDNLLETRKVDRTGQSFTTLQSKYINKLESETIVYSSFVMKIKYIYNENRQKLKQLAYLSFDGGQSYKINTVCEFKYSDGKLIEHIVRDKEGIIVGKMKYYYYKR